mmetsp:Transcript_36571/g.58954  ORF Transcript_36571/g.58954 Transcript_36571/m.58954 type:complete len:85 (+) Transcript_36571:77-331(+)
MSRVLSILLLLVAIQLCLVAAFAPVVAPSLRAIGKSSLTQVCGDKGKGEKPKKPKQDKPKKQEPAPVAAAGKKPVAKPAAPKKK